MTEKTAKNLSCQGKVFLYEEKTQCGFIKGFDKNVYSFSISEWKNKNEKPRIDMVVNFEIKDKSKEAISIKIR